MALPFSFSSELKWSTHLNMVHGPFEDGSNLYAVLLDKTANTLEVWKSTDGGDSWAEQDSANHKTISVDNSAKSASVFLDGTTLHIAYVTGTATLTIVPFSMSTDTYGTVITGGPSVATNLSISLAFTLLRRSDGDYVVFHNGATQNVMGNAYRRVVYSRYEGTTWTGNTDVGGVDAQIHYDARTAILGSSDRAHFFYTDTTNNDLKHRSLSSANVLGTIQDVDINMIGSVNYSVGLPVLNGSEVVLPYVDSTFDMNVARGTSATDPTWGITQVVTAVTDPEPVTANTGALALDGTTVYCFWPDNTDNDIYYDNDAGTGTWGTDTEWKDAITCNGINARAVTNGIGVLYDDNGTVKYDLYALAAATFAPPPRINPYHVMLAR